MSLNLGTMSAAVTLDVSQYQRNLSTLENESGKTFKRMAQAAAGFLTARALFGFANSAMAEFSKLEEGNNKLKYTFTEVRSEAERTAKQIAETYNLAPQTATNAIADIGDMLTGFGFAQSQALDFARQITERGIDVASFKGLDQTETINRMAAALTGETDSLKMMGVVIRQDTDEFRSLVKSIQESTGATETQAKAQAILTQIMKQTKNAEGDYLRPDAPRTYAQELTDLREAVKTFKLEIGTQIQPIAQDAVVRARELLNWYNQLTPASKELLGTTAALAAAFGVMAKTGMLSSANKAFSAVSGGFSGVQAKAEADAVAAAENLKRAEYEKTDAFRQAKAAAQSVRVAKLAVEEQKAAVATARVQLQQAQASGNASQVLAAKKQLAVATESLTRAQIAESAATQKLAASHAVARAANIQHAAASQANSVATKASAAAATLSGRAHIVMAGCMTTAKNAAYALNAAIGPVGWTMIALSAAYAAFSYMQTKQTNAINGQAQAAAEATKKMKELAEAHAKEREAESAGLSRLEELARYERLNNSERQEAEKLIDTLTKRYGDLGVSIDETTGKLIFCAEAWGKLNEQQAQEFMNDSIEKEKALIQELTAQYNKLTYEMSNGLLKFSHDWISEYIPAQTLLEKEVDLIRRDTRSLENKIIALDNLRKYLVSEGGHDNEIQQLEIVLDLMRQIQAEPGKRKNFNQSRQDRTAEEAKAQSEAQRKAQESVKTLEWEIRFDKADAEEQARMLSEKMQEIFNRQSGKYGSLEAFKNADRNSMTEKELEDLEEIIRLEEQRKQIREESAKAFEEEQRRNKEAFESERKRNEEFFKNREKQKADEEIERQIQEANRAGDSETAKRIIQQQLVQARQSADSLKQQYDKALREAEADGVMTEEEKKNLDNLHREMERAYAEEDRWAKRAEQEQNSEKDTTKTVGDWSAKVLAAMLGPSNYEQEIAKNSKKSVDLQRKIAENTSQNVQNAVETYES